uniref:Uncharacterized protein n=1 Tax=Physcomitrium patens TaxID=3218 RepID=A0A2K1JYW9_PHYPA|nr:hypothetical protein PHYPA_013842 [Physcomitrium patens]
MATLLCMIDQMGSDELAAKIILSSCQKKIQKVQKVTPPTHWKVVCESDLKKSNSVLKSKHTNTSLKFQDRAFIYRCCHHGWCGRAGQIADPTSTPDSITPHLKRRLLLKDKNTQVQVGNRLGLRLWLAKLYGDLAT